MVFCDHFRSKRLDRTPGHIPGDNTPGYTGLKAVLLSYTKTSAHLVIKGSDDAPFLNWNGVSHLWTSEAF